MKGRPTSVDISCEKPSCEGKKSKQVASRADTGLREGFGLKKKERKKRNQVIPELVERLQSRRLT